MSLHEYLPQMDLYCEHLNKITLSTELAQATKTPEQRIPDWCSDLEDVFSEKTHNALPLIDHMTIPLIFSPLSFQRSQRCILLT